MRLLLVEDYRFIRRLRDLLARRTAPRSWCVPERRRSSSRASCAPTWC